MLLAEKKPAVSIKRSVFTCRTSFSPCITLSRSLKIVITLTFVTVNNPAAPHFSGLFLQLSGSRSPSAPHFVWVEQYLLAGRCNLAQFLDWGSVASVHDYKFQLFISSAAYFWAVNTALFGACGLTLLSLICKCCCIAVLGVPPEERLEVNCAHSIPSTATGLVRLQMASTAQAFRNYLFKGSYN